MSLKIKSIKWMGRLGLMMINRCLLFFVEIKKLKCINAKFYAKRNIDLCNPKKLNEKLLYAYYDSNMDMLARLTDKYQVREYVRERGLQDILVPVYGVYSSFGEIDFDVLPKKFVIKATHGCDMNYICLDKAKLNLKKLHREIYFWLHCKMAYMSLELHYDRIQPRIMCEKYLETKGEIIDYKFHCCNGKVLFVLVCSERSKGLCLDVFMPNWEHRPEVIVRRRNNPEGIEKPGQLKRMLEIAEKLSEGLEFVRVDLYEVDNKVYFGELTFTPATGVMTSFSDEFLLEQGRYWDER